MSQLLSERLASRVARQPAEHWGAFVVWAAITAFLLFWRWSEGNLTALEVVLYALLWVLLAYMAIVFQGFRRLLAAQQGRVDEPGVPSHPA